MSLGRLCMLRIICLIFVEISEVVNFMCWAFLFLLKFIMQNVDHIPSKMLQNNPAEQPSSTSLSIKDIAPVKTHCEKMSPHGVN
jgi:hypothetical protein